MKCRECSGCSKGFFASHPDDYVCIGVKEPFIIDDIDAECTEYDWADGHSYPKLHVTDKLISIPLDWQLSKEGSEKVKNEIERVVQEMHEAIIDEKLQQIADVVNDPETVVNVTLFVRIKELELQLESVKRERDAAVEAVEMYPCFTCKNISSAHCKDCLRNRSLVLDRFTKHLPDNYEWRGVCHDNTEVQEDGK